MVIKKSNIVSVKYDFSVETKTAEYKNIYGHFLFCYGNISYRGVICCECDKVTPFIESNCMVCGCFPPHGNYFCDETTEEDNQKFLDDLETCAYLYCNLNDIHRYSVFEYIAYDIRERLLEVGFTERELYNNEDGTSQINIIKIN